MGRIKQYYIKISNFQSMAYLGDLQIHEGSFTKHQERRASPPRKIEETQLKQLP